jgi:GntR family transcriptional regulator/MocR family aminotransferase
VPTLALRGVRRLAVENPAHFEQRAIVERAALAPVPIPVDDRGIRVDLLAGAACEAVLVTPAHQFPTGGVLAPERRAALLEWARESGAIVIEDDYDAEYRYDRQPVGALQGLEPALVAYCGSTSKTLAPALRLGWLAVPPPLLDAIVAEKRFADLGSPRLDQLALADFVDRGELDRHLRRMRQRYRRRRDALVEALAETLPEARVTGIAAGLHALVELPEGIAEKRFVAEAARRSIAVGGLAQHRLGPSSGRAAVVLGYAALPEPAIRRGVRELAAAARAAAAA